MDPNVPLLWRMDKDVAGSGVTGDLHSHIVDISNYLAGDIESVAGTSQHFRRTSASGPRAAAAKSRSRTLPSLCASTRTARSAISKRRASPTAARTGTRSRSTASTAACISISKTCRGSGISIRAQPKHVQGWTKDFGLGRSPSLHETLVGAGLRDRIRAHFRKPGRRSNECGGRRPTDAAEFRRWTEDASSSSTP